MEKNHYILFVFDNFFVFWSRLQHADTCFCVSFGSVCVAAATWTSTEGVSGNSAGFNLLFSVEIKNVKCEDYKKKIATVIRDDFCKLSTDFSSSLLEDLTSQGWMEVVALSQLNCFLMPFSSSSLLQ